jgi:DNA-binding GntR family transcriptional regulator
VTASRRPSLGAIQRRNLREDAVEVLRAAILGGELGPGSIHSAVTLSETLGVSPTPVREAMLELSRSGLVEVVPNRGFRVTVANEPSLDKIAELRQLLEVPAMQFVIDRADDEQLAALQGPLATLEAAAERNDVAEFLVADRDFHLRILALTGNHRMVEIIAELRDQTRIVGLRSLALTQSLAATAAEHRPILDALIARDKLDAARRMRRHLEHTRGTWAGHSEQGP